MSTPPTPPCPALTQSARIVALETSGRIGSVAVARGGELLEERRFSHTMRHAADLMPTLRELCARQGWSPDQIDELYVSTGPGSFTGLRIALAIARAMHQAIGCRLVGIPTLDVLALNAPEEVRHLVVVLDAKRGQVFAGRYERQDENLGKIGHLRVGPFVRTAGPALVDPAAFVGQTPRPVHVLGEGVDYHRAALLSAGAIEVDRARWPARAAAVHALGYQRAQAGAYTPAASLLPVYVRLAEAEEVWRKKHGVPLDTP